MDWSPLIQAAEQRFNLPPGLLGAMMHQESGGKPNAVSPKGARGLMQLEPGTARDMGVTDINDPVQNVFGGARYMRQQLDTFGSIPLALAAYNAGPNAVTKAGGIPDNDETPGYVENIMARYGAPANAGVQLAQPIDPNSVKWDDAGPATGAIDPNSVKWDDAGPVAAPTPKAAAPAPKPMTAREKAADLLTNSPVDQLTEGALHGVTNTVGGAIQHGAHGLGWLLNKMGMPNADAAVTGAGDKAAQFLQQGTPQSVPGMVGEALGASVMPFPKTGKIIPSVAAAAGYGAAQPVQPGQNFANQTVKNAEMGGAAGAAGNIAGKLIGGVATPEARELMDRGVLLTPGQAAGGFARSMEEKSRSLVGVGDAISSAEQAATRSYNKMLYQDALSPIGKTLPKGTEVGSEGVDAVRSMIGDEFNRLAGQASFTPRGVFIRDLGNIRTDLAQRAPSVLDQFDTVVGEQIGAKLQNGTMNGSQWNDSRSFIAGLSRDNRLGDTTPPQRALADALDDLNEAMNTQVARQSGNAQFRQQLTNANNAYARYKRVETAAGMQGASNQSNVFSPAQYASAVRKGSTAFQRATNTGLNADIASKAQQVLGKHYPDSGTPGRLAANAALAGTWPFTHGAVLGAAAGIPLYGTNLGRQAMLTALARRPELLQQLGLGASQLSPTLGVLGGQLSVPGQSQ